MELQLGLALPTSPPPSSKAKGGLLDLNSCAPSIPSWSHTFHNKKRTSTQLIFDFDHLKHTITADDTAADNREVLLPTLSLLPLTPPQSHPNNDDNHPTNCSTISVAKNVGDDVEGPVGWPPINSWRKKLRYDNDGHEAEAAGNEEDQVVWIDHHHRQYYSYGSVGVRGSSNSLGGLYVKVKMEGVGIARKVDLSIHHSFHTLKQTLMDMFGKRHQQSNCYQLAYQDREGDWLLAEDVPWRSFIRSAQRLKLLKSSG